MKRVGEYERCLLGKEYARSIAFLDSIENDFCISLWSIENRIASFQVAQGLEQQKAYVNAIRGARVSNAVEVFAFYVSQRNESATNPIRFKEQMAERAASWLIPREYRNYLRYKISGDWSFSLQACADLLRFEATSSVLDYYETFVSVAQEATVKNSMPESLLSSLELLSSKIEDYRVQKILLLNLRPDAAVLSTLQRQDVAPLESLARNEFKSAAVAAGVAVEADPKDVSLRLVSAQSKAELDGDDEPEAGLGNRIERLCRQLVTKKEQPEDTLLEITRLRTAFHMLSFSGPMRLFEDDYFSSQLTPNKDAVLRAFLNSPYLDPRYLAWLPDELKGAYMRALLDRYGSPPAIVGETLRANLKLPGNESDLGSIASFGTLGRDFRLRVEIDKALSSHTLPDALALARELDFSESLYARRFAARYIADCLLQLHNLAEAIDIVVTRVISDPPSVFMLPVAECVDGLDKATRKSLASKLSTPIILDLYSRFFSDRFDNIRAYAYEDFLIAHGVERPSELVTLVDHFDRKLLTYYLAKVCSPEIIQVSSTFRGSKQLEQERVEVCSLLRQIDESRAKEYELEIKEITQNQLIQMGARHFDLSRIFVDVVAIRRWAERNLREGYTRYRALLEAGVDTGTNAFAEALEEVLSEGPTEAAAATAATLALPKNEATNLLFDLVSRVFLECMKNPEYGLDCYLSMRIRHGALSGQLRGPLEEQKVITQRESGSRQYKSNEYWLARLTFPSSLARTDLDVRLRRFSHEYDTIIETFAGQFVQVHTTEKQAGLFSTAIPEVYFGALASGIKQDTTFDDFITSCFDLFWRCVDRDLVVLRDKIDREIKLSVNSLFATFQSDLAEMPGLAQPQELSRAMSIAQTGAQNALNQVNEWFRLRKPETVLRLRLEEIIDICLKCMDKIHPNFEPQIRQTIPVLPPVIDWTPLSDIFFIVFENIQNHSGMQNPLVEISATENEDQVRISIRSEIGHVAEIGEAKEKVAKIKVAISEGAYQRGVRSEGGTGLMKLRKTIGTARHLDFGFASDAQFYVEFDLLYR